MSPAFRRFIDHCAAAVADAIHRFYRDLATPCLSSHCPSPRYHSRTAARLHQIDTTMAITVPQRRSMANRCKSVQRGSVSFSNRAFGGLLLVLLTNILLLLGALGLNLNVDKLEFTRNNKNSPREWNSDEYDNCFFIQISPIQPPPQQQVLEAVLNRGT